MTSPANPPLRTWEPEPLLQRVQEIQAWLGSDARHEAEDGIEQALIAAFRRALGADWTGSVSVVRDGGRGWVVTDDQRDRLKLSINKSALQVAFQGAEAFDHDEFVTTLFDELNPIYQQWVRAR